MSITTAATPSVPHATGSGPVGYQHRARLRCPRCFAATPQATDPYGAAVVTVPRVAPALVVATRRCVDCGAAIPVPGLFGLGRVAATNGTVALCEADRHGANPIRLLTRHWTGDWGAIGEDDYGVNEGAIRDDARLLSVYPTPSGQRLWIVTEAGRQATTLLLPEED